MSFNLQKALAMAIDSRMAMMGMMMMADPRSEKGGGAKGGALPSISPVNVNVHV